MNTLTLTRAATQMDSLPAILTDEEDQVPVNEHWIVDTLEKALWSASKVAQAQKAVEELTELSRVFHDKVDAWFTKASAPHLETMGYLGSLLKPFVTERLTGVRARSLVVPGYRIGLRATPARVVVEDAEKALAWLEKSNPEVIQVRREIQKAPLKTLLAAGLEVPGASLTSGDEVLYVQEEK